MDYIIGLLSQLFYFIYLNFSGQNYGISLIIFTVVVRLAMTPLSISQAKNTAKMQKIQPELQQLQKRYGNNKEKLAEAQMKLYQENNYSLFGGCLPMLIQLPLILLLFQVISKPLTYIFNWSAAAITAGTSELNIIGKLIPAYPELSIVNFLGLLNMNFLKIFDLGRVPAWQPNILFGPEKGIYLPLLILPVISLLSTILYTKIFSVNNPQPQAKDKKGNDSNPMAGYMTYVTPVITFIFGFQFPAGLSLYWTIGNFVMIGQQMIINKYFIKDYKKDKNIGKPSDAKEVVEAEIINDSENLAKEENKLVKEPKSSSQKNVQIKKGMPTQRARDIYKRQKTESETEIKKETE